MQLLFSQYKNEENMLHKSNSHRKHEEYVQKMNGLNFLRKRDEWCVIAHTSLQQKRCLRHNVNTVFFLLLFKEKCFIKNIHHQRRCSCAKDIFRLWCRYVDVSNPSYLRHSLVTFKHALFKQTRSWIPGFFTITSDLVYVFVCVCVLSWCSASSSLSRPSLALSVMYLNQHHLQTPIKSPLCVLCFPPIKIASDRGLFWSCSRCLQLVLASSSWSSFAFFFRSTW